MSHNLKDDANLRDYAYDLIIAGLNNQPLEGVRHKDLGIWQDMHADLFVTAYHEQGDQSSSNVWCCYSNGDSQAFNTVPENMQGATVSCLDLDTRHEPISNYGLTLEPPAEVDLTILAPRDRWILIKDLNELSRDKKRALYVKTLNGSAFYIPSVWNERPDWKPEDIVASLARKAGGNPRSVLEIYEVPVYEIPTESLERSEFHEERNRGFFQSQKQIGSGLNYSSIVPNKVLEDAWHFYYDNSKPFTLVYEVKNSKPIYDNQGVWVRSIADIIAFDRVSKFLGKNVRIEPYVKALITDSVKHQNLDNPQTRAAIIELLNYFGLSSKKDVSPSFKLSPTDPLWLRIKNSKIKNLRNFEELKPGIYDTDLSFANPQIIMAISSDPTNKNIRSLKRYLDTIDSQIDIAVNQNGAFAANWIAQALEKIYDVLIFYDEKPKTDYYLRKIEFLASEEGPLLNLLIDKAFTGDSVTERACAITGLEALYKINPNDNTFKVIQDGLYDILKYQLPNPKGGFPYALDNDNLIRTDVTSHVVEAILRYLDFEQHEVRTKVESLS